MGLSVPPWKKPKLRMSLVTVNIVVGDGWMGCFATEAQFQNGTTVTRLISDPSGV